MLIPYAGKDTDQGPNLKAERAYMRFKLGYDTYDIARFYRMSEATVLRWITSERDRLRNERMARHDDQR